MNENKQDVLVSGKIFEKTIPFSRLFKLSFISLIIIAAGIYMYFINKGFYLGIDFKGGVKIECVIKNNEANIKTLRTLFTENKIESEITVVGNPEEREFMITLPIKSGEDFEKIITDTINVMETKFGKGSVDVRGREIVEPKVGETFAGKAIQLLVVVSILILFYILVRFDIFYSFGAVVALLHDALVMLAFTLFLKIPIDITIIAAILTVLGYSVNDTIVVFDRIRELHLLSPMEEFSLLIDKATTQTLNRTIITALTTIFVSVALYLFGGIVLKNFALVLTIGFISGTYSSIFIASMLTYYLRKAFNRK
ncbi:MAG: protein translocase subunit SecF [Brevinematales bacterium]|nr:protein translocase subunit SecF [Brevinematales bacterium]